MSISRPSAGSLILSRVRGLIDRPFVRDVGILQIGVLLSAGVGFVASIILARTLGAEQYGTYALVVSLGTTIGILRRLGQDHAATTRLATAIAREDRPDASNAMAYFVAIGVWSAIAVLPVAILVAPLATQWLYSSAELGELLRLYLLPVSWSVFSATLVLALQTTRHIKELAWLENGSSVLLAIAAIAGALVGASAGAVLLSQLLVSLAVAVISVWGYQWLRRRVGLLPSVRTLAGGVLRPRFPIWRDTRSGLAMALDKNLATIYPLFPVLFLGAAAATSDVADLRIALSYIAIPALLLAPISRLLMVKLPEVHARTPERLRSFFRSVSLTGMLISIALTLPFAVGAPWIIKMLYGAAYQGSVPLAMILAVDSALLGFGLAAGPLFRTLDRTDLPIRVHIVVLLIGLPLAFVLIRAAGAVAAASSYVAMMLAVRVATNALCWRLLSSASR
jgi:O-antigen/teichoic acid export membrane protein